MSRSTVWITVLVLVAQPGATGLYAQNDGYRLEFDGPTHLDAPAGKVLRQDYLLLLGHTGPGVPADSNGDGGISEGERGSAQSWSVSLIAEGGEITRIQTGVGPDDDVETDASRIYSQGFEHSELTTRFEAGSECDGQRGAMSVIQLSWYEHRMLPANRSSSIAVITVEASSESGDGVLRLRCVEGCQGSGQPVPNVVTHLGESRFPVRKSLQVSIQVLPAHGAPFVRGNANGDSRVDIADPIWIIQELFYEGPASICEDASDANDDGFVDLSDAAFLIDYLFRGRSPPPFPFGTCGADPDGIDDGLSCDTLSAMCLP